jgi:hypothetical protein
VSDVEANPSEILAGAVDIGDCTERSVQLRSHSGRGFCVEAVECSSEHVVVSEDSADNQLEPRYRIILRPTCGGDHQALVRFHLRQDDEVYPCDLRVHYFGRGGSTNAKPPSGIRFSRP